MKLRTLCALQEHGYYFQIRSRGYNPNTKKEDLYMVSIADMTDAEGEPYGPLAGGVYAESKFLEDAIELAIVQLPDWQNIR